MEEVFESLRKLLLAHWLRSEPGLATAKGCMSSSTGAPVRGAPILVGRVRELVVEQGHHHQYCRRWSRSADVCSGPVLSMMRTAGFTGGHFDPLDPVDPVADLAVQHQRHFESRLTVILSGKPRLQRRVVDDIVADGRAQSRTPPGADRERARCRICGHPNQAVRQRERRWPAAPHLPASILLRMIQLQH
jgi:hypothetical protein